MTAIPAPLTPRCGQRLLWIDRVSRRTCDCHWMTVATSPEHRPDLPVVAR